MVMTPMELLAKFASLVPPPRYPLLQLSGVLGPRSSWRASVVPKPAPKAQPAHGCGSAAMGTQGEHEQERHTQAGGVTTKTADVVVHKVQTGAHRGDATSKLAGIIEPELLVHAGGAATKTAGLEDKKLAPGSARTALGSGVVRGQGVRVDWASLLKRVFLGDVLACPCGGRRRIVSDVQERSAVVAILEHLALPAEAPPLARARDPDDRFGFGQAAA
jgi:hypothetical protein